MKSNRNLRSMYRKLVSNPFFPLLFIGEAIKLTVLSGPNLEMAGLALIATAMWVVSDDVEDAVETIAEETNE